MIDCHTHSNYSPDGYESLEDMIRAAAARGISYIALTDHLDFDSRGVPTIPLPRLKQYASELFALKEKYRAQIEVAAGLEVGFKEPYAQKAADMLDGLGLEFIINSVHEAKGVDCFYPEYYAGKSKEQAYNEYFDAVLKSLDAPYPYHAVGHLGYVERKAPYKDPVAHYTEFRGILSDILQKIVSKQKILEINTNLYGAPVPFLPNAEILSEYKKAGGTRVTFSSDAHKPARLGDKYDFVAAEAKRFGFSGFYIISGGKEKLLPF